MDSLFKTGEALKQVRRAFTDLRKAGIEASLDCQWCASCGNVVTPFFNSFVYCLREDVQEFQNSGVLFVRFCTPETDYMAKRALGDQVRISLEMRGLRVDWDGDPHQMITVFA